MRRTNLTTAAGNPWLLWGSFALGFLIPWCFLLFLPLAAIAAWRELSNEYEEVALHWSDAARSAAGRMKEEAAPLLNDRTASPLSCGMV